MLEVPPLCCRPQEGLFLVWLRIEGQQRLCSVVIRIGGEPGELCSMNVSGIPPGKNFLFSEFSFVCLIVFF